MEYVKTLKEIHRGEEDLVGQRAVDLALLSEKEFLVPLSFAISNEAFEAFITSNSLLPKITAAIAATSDQNRQYEAVRELIIEGSFPQEIVHEIVEAYESLGVEVDASLDQMVAANEAPFVNIILSPNYTIPVENREGIILNVRGLEELLLAVKECWACLFTPTMQRHRAEAGIGNQHLNTGILVQYMATGEVSGEGWSATGSKTSELTIKTYYGALDIGVNVEKDEFRITKEYLKLVYSSVAIQTAMLARDEEERLGKVPIGIRGEEQKVNDKMVIELARLTKKASSSIDRHVKLYFNLKEDRVKTLLCNRLLLTKGAVKLEGYQEEERIEEEPGERTEIEEERTIIAGDEESGEAEILDQQESNEVRTEFEVAGEEADDAPEEQITPGAIAEDSGEEAAEEQQETRVGEEAAAEETPAQQEEPVTAEKRTATEERSPEIPAEIEAPDEEAPGKTPEATEEDETDSIFAHMSEEQESGRAETELEETRIAADPESGEAEVLSQTEEEDVDEETREEPEEEPAPVTGEAESRSEAPEQKEAPEEQAAEAEEPEEAAAAENGEEEPGEGEKEAAEAPTRSFDEACEEVVEALTQRYENRFRNRPPESPTELFFELSSEIIIPHEEEITRLIRHASGEEQLTEAEQATILTIIDDFLEEIR